jgi:uncharacterized protein
MKLHVPSIPENGKRIELHPGLAWVRDILSGRLGEICDPKSGLTGEIGVLRTHVNVTLQGQVHFNIKPVCDRCGKRFEREMNLSFHRYLTPYFGNPDEKREAGEEEVELSEEDLNFSFYHQDEIDLSEILAEEVFLSLPMGFLCRPDCKGLCPRCGADLNWGACGCEKIKEDSPFKVLKSLKLPGKTR